MRADIVAGALFPDYELTDQTGKHRKLSDLQRPDPMILVLSLNGQTLISLTANYPHQQLIDKESAKAKVICRSGQTVNLLDTQIGLVEAEEGIAIIPSFGLPARRSRKVAMSELVDPTVNLEFCEISSRGKKMPEGAAEFSTFLKKYIARWAGEAGAL